MKRMETREKTQILISFVAEKPNSWPVNESIASPAVV